MKILLNMLYILFLLISIMLQDCSSNSGNIQDYTESIDLNLNSDSICFLSEIADSIMYYPIYSERINDKNNVELLSDYIWINYRNDSIRASLLNRKDGFIIYETTISALLQDGGFWLSDYFNTFFRLKDEKTLVSPASTIKGIKRYWHSVSMDTSTGERKDTIDFPYKNGVEYFRLNDQYILRLDRIIGDDIRPRFKMDWYTCTLDSIKQDVFPDTVYQTFLSWNQTKVHLLKDKIYFHFPTMKTIYEISPNHSPIPLYRYEVGKHGHKYNKINDVQKYWEDESKGLLSCFAIRTSLMAENYIFGGFNYKGFIHRVLFDRQKHRKWIIPTKCTADYQTSEGIINDLDGGLDFWPRKVSRNGEIYTWYNVEELKVKISQSDPERMKNPKAAKQLKDMLDNLPKDVNCIIAVLKEINR